jgi:hypothetical protein
MEAPLSETRVGKRPIDASELPGREDNRTSRLTRNREQDVRFRILTHFNPDVSLIFSTEARHSPQPSP